MRPAVVPVATYRLQFNAGFTFVDATAIVEYLHALGVSHCYASSYLRAVPGSLHGYDVADPTQLNPEIGDETQFRAWVDAVRAHGMGHIVDFVPNHMGIAKSANPWWQDVLENGPSSRYASVFDIDWQPLKPELENKVLLPILGDSYGAVLERQQIVLQYDAGTFWLQYFDYSLPIAPRTYDRLLGTDVERLVNALGASSVEAAEYLSILTAVRRLPGREERSPELQAERDREKKVIRRRLAALTGDCAVVRDHISAVVTLFNGTTGNPLSFDRLDDLLDAQAYRLAHWRVAAEEINYRRFFDINELAAIRMEDPAVFDRVHEFAFRLLEKGLLDGFRIDHVDGLYDPGDYLARLQARARAVRPDLFADDRRVFVVVEKILGIDERLPDWPVEGTTGYDFLALVNGLFVDTRNERPINDIYERFTRLRTPFREIAYRSKQLVLRLSMASELNVLAHRLNTFSERSRHYRDFTLISLVQAMREIIANFPVYRTYVNVREAGVSEHDRRFVEYAVDEAKRRNPGRPPAVFDFVRDLLLKQADYIPENERDEHMRFIGKFQQVTSPVTARGIEDTAFYNYNRLGSLNEVGSDPENFGVTPDQLHARLVERARRWPHALSTTSTHDTKRSEDVRARLNVLSELPGAWKQAAGQWARLNRRARTTIGGQSYPSRNEEYLLYQTLVGSWPLQPMDADAEQAYRQRIVEYMRKAMREAKVVTSWLNPSEPHEQAMTDFVETILATENQPFRDSFLEFHRRIAQYGLYNSLSQLAIKVCAPGVPDFYQGTELWNFSLVDPDNRGSVDYARRCALLNELRACSATDAARLALVERLMTTPRDDRLKLYATMTILQFRNANAEAFAFGRYDPLVCEGPRRDHVFSFARDHQGRQVLVVVPRLVASLLPDADVPPLGERVWGDSRIHAGTCNAINCYRDAFTGKCVPVQRERDVAFLRVADVLAHFPIALLETQ